MKDKPKTRDAELCMPWSHRLLTRGGGSGLPAILRRGVQVSLGRAVLQWQAGVDGVVVHGVAVHGHQQALPGAWGKGRWDSSSGFPHGPPSSALLGGHTGRCRAEGKLSTMGSDARQQDSPARPPNPAPQSHTGRGKPEQAHFCCTHAMRPALCMKCEAWKGCGGLRACSGLPPASAPGPPPATGSPDRLGSGLELLPALSLPLIPALIPPAPHPAWPSGQAKSQVSHNPTVSP